MTKHTFTRLFTLAAILSFILFPAQAIHPGQAAGANTSPEWAWQKEALQNYNCLPDYSYDYFYDELSAQSMQADSNGRIHLAFGGCKLYYGIQTRGEWKFEIIDNSPRAGGYASLVLDPGGLPGISYMDYQNGDLKYAHWDGSKWEVQVVDDGPNWIGGPTSLAFNSLGHPHIFYSGRYASWTGSAWITETLVTGPEAASGSLAINSLDQTSISYLAQDYPSVRLSYIYRDGAAWKTDDIGQAGPGLTSLALLSDGSPAIAYIDKNGFLGYAHKNAAGWTTRTLYAYSTGGVSLTIDQNDLPHISYMMEFASGVKAVQHTYRSGTTWKTDTPGIYLNDAASKYYQPSAYSTSITQDSSGKIHIAAGVINGRIIQAIQEAASWKVEDAFQGHAYALGDLMINDSGSNRNLCFSYMDYANLSNNLACWQPGSTWTYIQALTGLFHNAPYAPLFALGPDGNPQMVYQDHTADNIILNYGHWDGKTWQTEEITRTVAGNFFRYALAVDKSGLPHIVTDKLQDGYSISPSYGRTYYWKSNSGWNKENIPFDAGTGMIARLDPLGNLHVVFTFTSYMGMTPSGFRYIKRQGGAWQEIFYHADSDRSDDAVRSLAVDKDGLAHFAYTDGNPFNIDYLHYQGSGWIVTPLSVWGSDPAIAVDASATPYIRFFSSTYPDYVSRLAILSGSSWLTQTLPVNGETSNPVIDAAGRIHLAYLDQSNGEMGHLVGFQKVTPMVNVYLPQIMK